MCQCANVPMCQCANWHISKYSEINYMKIVLLSLSILICSYAEIAAQQKGVTQPGGKQLSVENIDKLVTALMDSNRVAGLCLGIINENQPVYVQAYGYKNKEENERNDTATCFYAASLAKPLFAYIVMHLVDDKLIELDKPLYTYLPKPIPEYEDYKDLAGDDRWKLITARNCLDHTTGFPNWRWANPHGNKKLEIFFTPGERYAYSGEGLVLLQMVAETITGKSLETLAVEDIFVPFNMYRTSFLWQPSFESDYAYGYDENGKRLKKNKRTKTNAAGSMETTIADYSRFISSVMQQKGISDESRKQMFSPQIKIYTKHQFPSLNTDTTQANQPIQLAYGLGWGLFKTPFGMAFFKEGHDDGWGHYVICLPDKKTALLIMTNSSRGEGIFKELVEKIMEIEIPWEWEGYTPYQLLNIKY
jgi:CubicO group peptidase (beta-lactamase class C family)